MLLSSEDSVQYIIKFRIIIWWNIKFGHQVNYLKPLINDCWSALLSNMNCKLLTEMDETSAFPWSLDLHMMWQPKHTETAELCQAITTRLSLIRTGFGRNASPVCASMGAIFITVSCLEKGGLSALFTPEIGGSFGAVTARKRGVFTAEHTYTVGQWKNPPPPGNSLRTILFMPVLMYWPNNNHRVGKFEREYSLFDNIFMLFQLNISGWLFSVF